jgi:hypothetical protein
MNLLKPLLLSQTRRHALKIYCVGLDTDKHPQITRAPDFKLERSALNRRGADCHQASVPCASALTHTHSHNHCIFTHSRTHVPLMQKGVPVHRQSSPQTGCRFFVRGRDPCCSGCRFFQRKNKHTPNFQAHACKMLGPSAPTETKTISLCTFVRAAPLHRFYHFIFRFIFDV